MGSLHEKEMPEEERSKSAVESFDPLLDLTMGMTDDEMTECFQAAVYQSRHRSTSTLSMRRTASTPAACMDNATSNNATPAALLKNGSKNPSLTSENNATRTNGMTLTMRADSLAWAVCT